MDAISDLHQATLFLGFSARKTMRHEFLLSIKNAACAILLRQCKQTRALVHGHCSVSACWSGESRVQQGGSLLGTVHNKEEGPKRSNENSALFLVQKALLSS